MSSTRYQFELLAANHDVSQFSSSATYIDSFLKEQALELTKLDRALTYVLIDVDAEHANGVIGFFYVACTSPILSKRVGCTSRRRNRLSGATRKIQGPKVR